MMPPPGRLSGGQIRQPYAPMTMDVGGHPDRSGGQAATMAMEREWKDGMGCRQSAFPVHFHNIIKYNICRVVWLIQSVTYEWGRSAYRTESGRGVQLCRLSWMQPWRVLPEWM
ncbi:hypothetical protein CFR76_02295 [Komagataeibacter swingsii]|uniref:Uncharacterized protein n=1 Tax=Komagataeibacter swingsii TaxID=215220 RepID=A0A2V4RQ93_9PROT|nr:hypothetical protein CFR76_02295 [Komagataeibacter swingsii]